MKNSIIIFLIILIIGCNENPIQISHTPQNKIIPTPKEIKYLSNKKCLKLPKDIKVYSSDASLRPIVTIFVEQLNLLGHKHQLSFDKTTNANMSIMLDETLKTEEYQINIDQSVILSGGSYKAISSAMSSGAAIESNMAIEI